MVKTQIKNQIEVWTVPQPIGFNGICMSSIGVEFLKNVPSEACHHFITDLSLATNTFLKPDSYGGDNFLGDSENMILNGLGVNGLTSSSIKLDFGDIWLLDSDNKLTKQESTYIASNPIIYSASSCTATNVVKEAYYNIEYLDFIEGEQTGFKIKSISVDLVLLDSLQIDAQYCAETTGSDQISSEGYNFEMKFGIEFKPRKLDSIPGGVVEKSGNPGYMTQYHIIVGENPDFTLPQKVNQNGFIIKQHDLAGKCFKAETLADGVLSNDPHQSINFEELTYLTCSIDLTLEDLKSYCEGTNADYKFEEYEIFKQFYTRFNYVSLFGDANILYEKDWSKVIFETPIKPPTGTWNEATSTCTGVVGFNIRFITSKLGFFESLQKYIVAAEVADIKEDWQFTADAGETQQFMHIVSMQFHEVVHEAYLNATKVQSSFFLPKLPSDLFYPFELEY